MAIGSLDKAGRLEQLKGFARVLVWSGYTPPDDVRAEVFAAVLDEVGDAEEARTLTAQYVDEARNAHAEAEATWPSPSGFDHLQAAISDLRTQGVIVLEACDDHWAANAALEEAAASGRSARGVAYFTHADVWHAVEHGMLELNVWHGNSANVAPGDDLLDLVRETLRRHGIDSHFDEGRLEVTVRWERRSEGLTHPA